MKKRLLIVLGVLLCMVSGAREDSVTVRGFKGRLAVLVRVPDLPEGETCPAVILFHGFNDSKNAAMLVTLAESLESSGIASVRFDFNGHGGSDGVFRDMTVRSELADADSIYNFVRALPFVDSISFAGHSQGGLVAAMLAGMHASDGIRSVLLIAPGVNIRDDAWKGDFFGHKFDAVNLPDSLTFSNGKVVMGKDYILDARTLPIYETLDLYDGPVCIIQGTNDRFVQYEYSLHLFERYPHCEIHLMKDIDHSLMPGQTANLKPAVDFLIGK